MWWGRGDTSKLTDRERATLDHLRRLDETGHLQSLNPERAAVATRAVEFYGQWESFLRLLVSVKNVSLLVGALLGIYWLSQGTISAWIARVAAGGQ